MRLLSGYGPECDHQLDSRYFTSVMPNGPWPNQLLWKLWTNSRHTSGLSIFLSFTKRGENSFGSRGLWLMVEQEVPHSPAAQINRLLPVSDFQDLALFGEFSRSQAGHERLTAQSFVLDEGWKLVQFRLTSCINVEVHLILINSNLFVWLSERRRPGCNPGCLELLEKPYLWTNRWKHPWTWWTCRERDVSSPVQ